MTNKTKIFGIAEYTDGTIKHSRSFVNPEAFSRWANKQFRLDEGVTVEEYHMEMFGEFRTRLYSTWHA